MPSKLFDPDDEKWVQLLPADIGSHVDEAIHTLERGYATLTVILDYVEGHCNPLEDASSGNALHALYTVRDVFFDALEKLKCPRPKETPNV